MKLPQKFKDEPFLAWSLLIATIWIAVLLFGAENVWGFLENVWEFAKTQIESAKPQGD